MAIYYVDGDNGNDNNNGTSIETAWKTINKATQTMQAGDTTYVKAGIYREQVSFANSGSSSNYISLIGDVKGEFFGVKGEVIISLFDGSPNGYANRNRGLIINQKSYINIKNITLIGANTSSSNTIILVIQGGAGGNYLNFENIKIFGAEYGNYYCMGVILGYGGKATNITFNNCIFDIKNRETKVSPYFSSCVVYNISSIYSDIYISFNNCIFANAYNGYYEDYVCQPIYFYNCLFHNLYYAFRIAAGTPSGSTKFYNCYFSNIYDLSPNDTSSIDKVSNYGCNSTQLSDLSASFLIQPFNLSRILEFEENLFYLKDLTSTQVVNYDIENKPRPLGNNCDVGPFEYNPPSEKELSIVKSGNNSLKINKAGIQKIKTFLTSGEHTISVYTKWSNYSGSNKPQLIVKQDAYCGIASDQTDTATGDGSDWEELSVDITLTKDAEVEIWLYARDTGSSAVTYFDDLNIT